MAKVFIEETTLTAIGDAIRGKTGKTDLIDPANMSTEIASIEAGSGGDDKLPDEILLTGNCDYACSGPVAAALIAAYPEKLRAQDITNAKNLFENSTIEVLSLDLPFKSQGSLIYAFRNCVNLKTFNGTISWSADSTTGSNFSYIFSGCRRLETLPTMLNMRPMDPAYAFQHCNRLRYIPEDFFSTWSFYSYFGGTYYMGCNMFEKCCSLRHMPTSFSDAWPTDAERIAKATSPSYALYKYFTEGCHVLEDITDLPVIGAYTSNAFVETFFNCNRLSRLTFKLDNGAPSVIKWKGQTLDLTPRVGYVTAGYEWQIADYNSGITRDKVVTDDASYQALKNDPDWFATDVAYSRYNHDSAVETINSLPDTSAYLATAGGTNTIKFTGASGEKTDGGAINTLTEEEIAVATAKGWTVTLS